MKIKQSNLEWYVMRWDFNLKTVVDYNILEGVAEDLHPIIKLKKIYNKVTLKEYLRKKFIYRYWSKAECEFYISDLYGNEFIKIDMWRQIEPNLNAITDYINDKCELNFK